MIASLPMYDRPETATALDRLWAEMRRRLPGDAPEALTRGGDPWTDWTSPALLLSQTCGYPYRARLHGAVQLLGAADCALPDCPPGHYNSVFVVRADDPRTSPRDFAQARLAFNEPLSQSGWAAPQNHAAAEGFGFGRAVRTGGHLKSARAVASGHADIAALDAVTWRLISRFDRFADGLRVLTRTAPTPALPFITGASQDADAVRSALEGAIAAIGPAARDTLSLHALVRLPKSAYLAVPNPPPPPPDTPTI